MFGDRKALLVERNMRLDKETILNFQPEALMIISVIFLTIIVPIPVQSKDNRFNPQLKFSQHCIATEPQNVAFQSRAGEFGCGVRKIKSNLSSNPRRKNFQSNEKNSNSR